MAAPQSLVTALSAATASKPLTLMQRPANFGPTLWSSPSDEQIAATGTLLPFHDSDVFAWLSVIRSIEPNFQCRPVAGPLTKQQIDALSSLSPASDRDVRSWLVVCRRQSGWCFDVLVAISWEGPNISWQAVHTASGFHDVARSPDPGPRGRPRWQLINSTD